MATTKATETGAFFNTLLKFWPLIAALGFGVFYIWRLDDKVDDLAADVAEIANDTREDRCAQINGRRMTAIESGNEAVQAKLRELSSEQGCIRRYGVEVAAATEEMTEAERREAEARRRAEQVAFERDMMEIDEILNPQAGETLEFRFPSDEQSPQ